MQEVMDQIAEEEATTIVQNRKRNNDLSSQVEGSEVTINDDDYDIMVSYLKLFIY